ncbi:MAG: transglycosylase SLT domain-containing protein [Moraxellaceae bacterium]|nr:transglycosylase SLT domain-containing protein [Pseudobdellovibrionaceae bacterium]
MQFKFFFIFTLIFLANSVQAQESEKAFWKPPTFGEQKAMGYEYDTFTVPPPLKDEVNFWIKIYTQYTTTEGVFHVAGDINFILGEINLTDIYLNPKWGPIRRELEAKIVIERQRKFIAKRFGIKNPKTVRLQMGLKDRMQKAIFESGKYLPMMEQIFEENNIPKELTRVVFVESSFNPEARSKVGASGLWQIMPNVGRKYKYLQKSYDKRDHPKYATKLAADIFKQNFKILSSWPLAVTSYNFGVGSMLKVRKKMGTTEANKIFASEKVKKHIGFASRNFYATFLAALHVESHSNLYFGEPFFVAKPLNMESVYLAHDTKYEDLVQKYKMNSKEFKALNIHVESKFLKVGRLVPKGTLLSVPLAPTKTATIEN